MSFVLLSLLIISFGASVKCQSYYSFGGNACFDAVNIGSVTFNAPKDGSLIGIKLTNPTGGVSCSNSVTSYWGCEPDGRGLLGVNVIRNNIKIYPTSSTSNITQNDAGINDCSSPCATEAWNWYTSPLFKPNSNQLIFNGPSYEVTTSDIFKLEFGEACCRWTTDDNSGSTCADVYFLYFEPELTSSEAMIPVNGGYICNPLTDSTDIIYEIDYNTCLTECLSSNNCSMINYITNGKTEMDLRCYLFDTQCNIIKDNNNGNIIAIKGFNDICINYPDDWSDIYADTCYYYEEYKWCQNNTINNNFNITGFTVHTDQMYGLNAIQTCCECGGGLHIFDDIELEYSVSLFDGIDAFKNNDLCEWTAGDPNTDWNNMNLYDLCIKLKNNVYNTFEFLSNPNQKQIHKNDINCNIFIDTMQDKTNITLCNWEMDTELYFAAIFDVNILNKTTQIYLNSEWFNITDTYITDTISNTACQSLLSQPTLPSVLYGILPCDVIPTAAPTAAPTYDGYEQYCNEGPIKLFANNEVTQFTPAQNIYVEFDYLLHSKCPVQWCNVLHVGSSNIETRIPGFWINGYSDEIHIAFSNNINGGNDKFAIGNSPIVSVDNIVHHIIFEHTLNQRDVYIDGINWYTQTGDFINTYYHNIYPLYFSDPWHDALNATISNFCITTYTDSPITTIIPSSTISSITLNTSSVIETKDASTTSKDHTGTITALIVLITFVLLMLVIIAYIIWRKWYKASSHIHYALPNNSNEGLRIEQLEMEVQYLKNSQRATSIASTNSHQCILCCDNIANMFNYPCGHVSYCVNCSLKAIKQDNKCPSCRKEIKECKAIYSGGFKRNDT